MRLEPLFNIIKLVGEILSIVGGLFGIIAYIKVVKEEKREDKLWQKYIEIKLILKKTHGVWSPKIGSDDHKMAEEMVERGWLERGVSGGYRLPRSGLFD